MSPLQFRKKRSLDRSVAKRDAKIIVIATEGKKTEKQYFNLFGNSKIQVIILESIDNKSAPEYVLERLDNYYREYEIGPGDEFWLMVDVDRWGEKKLSRITQECIQKSFLLAISNPCFECWLLLHFEEMSKESVKCVELKNRLKKYLGGYDSSNLNLSNFSIDGNIRAAIERAKTLDIKQNERWPSKIGTRVYKVVDNILKMK